MQLYKGQVQIYTGNGKGKTTAALGLAFRAYGRGLKVCMIQFMKGGGPYGEHFAAERLAPELTIIPFGRGGWVDRDNPDPEDRRLAEEALKCGAEALTSGDYDLVILDEVNGAIHFGLLQVEQVLELIHSRPDCVELVLTGRNADQRIIDVADLVTEMREIKHYYKAGIPARVGIEK
ncbi:cob(I)yrinic acid a,c-diamide adenosyltransferase [Geobacter sp. OR-1]|uniref:cob(I)yrinic acid a,c-diamide adenosyltransferase n=1 Tax=Geobacter sp. OR-1 TaxID=1266765 RepID=UPI0005438A27|nr:cob(I)yrinic acid a,c-diamide adenosyltransferase [Geobacter sp. OR-1]GAM09950.1 cob(I)yrinic acid a,c-diamide adenosyltransferase [Geobacter sp. OR-1]